MTAQDTSKETLREIKNSGSVGRRERQVYEVIRKCESCPISVISQQLRLSPNKITGRLKTLRDDYKVVGFDKKDYCPVLLERTGDKRLVMFWKVVKDLDGFDDRESLIFVNSVGRCYKCGCLNCECEVL